MNRELWLSDLAEAMAPRFDELAAPLPAKIRMAVGFTSGGSKGKRSAIADPK